MARNFTFPIEEIEALAAEGMKRCVKCKKPKLYSEFRADKRSPDGYSYRCAQCLRTDDNAVAKERYKRNPLQQRVLGQNLRAKNKGVPGEITQDDVLGILNRQGHRCAYCGTDLIGFEFEIDHVQPIAKGGTNEPDNIALACGQCNRAKLDLEPGAFRAWLGRLTGKIMGSTIKEPRNYPLSAFKRFR